jgi:predicted nucleotide-binding protein
MKKDKTYRLVRYTPEVLIEALETLTRFTDDAHKKVTLSILSVDFPEEKWTHDSFEEFSADLRRSPLTYSYVMGFGSHALYVHQYANRCNVAVDAPTRLAIESTFEVFERHVATSRIELTGIIENLPTVFIGHGRSQQWRDLKDHLHEQHGYPVEAYEVGARAGHAIRDVLENMLEESSFAILVLTGEDEDKVGKLHPRLNVVHELGLFQGALGFSKAIALLEEGTEEFSNIHGIQQIRYSKGNIRETFGDILATLRREFFEDAA